MKRTSLLSLGVAALVLWASPVQADPILGSAESFAVLGGSTVTNTGPTTITGDVGLFPGPSVVGFAIPPANTVVEGPGSTGLVNGPGLVAGTIYISHAVAQQAQVDNTTAYNALAGLAPTANLTGFDLGGLTLPPGVYKFNTSAQLTGTLTLDALGVDGAFWVFQIGSTLTTASSSSVVIVNANALSGGTNDGLFWQVGSSATLGTSTDFEGNILALTSITLNTEATIHNGRALAQNGEVKMDTNTIDINSPFPNEGTLSGGLEFDDDGNLVPITTIPLPPVLEIPGPDGPILIPLPPLPPAGQPLPTVTPIPEPTSLLAFGSAAGVLFGFRRRILRKD
ncbi:MAG: ice-binding family protein [Planctomycetaceae bacterium]